MKSVSLGALLARCDPAAAPGAARSYWLELRGSQEGVRNTTSGHSLPAGATGGTPGVRFALYQSRPNPVRGTVLIPFDLPRASTATLELFDAQGRRIRRIRIALAPGRHELPVDLREEGGRALAAGVYAYRLTAGGESAERRLVVVP